jgi:DNA repair exonuclease SbcCD ATPase subunit
VRTSGKLNDDLDELFKLPLAEFTDARNTLAKQLKQSGRANDASLVKTLAKPSISAWTVNQLYWHHREAFDTLLAAGQRFRKAQTSGKVADMRGSLDARREALTELADLATSVLQDAGHNPTQETIRRVTTTLEAMSSLASFSDGPTPGRLSQDVDPPGFESLASFIPGTMKATAKPAAQKSDTSAREARRLEETRQVRIAAARAAVQAAKRSLADARVRAQTLESTHKKAYSETKQAEKQLREAEERFRKTKAAFESASQRSQSIAAEVEEATKAVEDAKRAIERASKELESLFSEP